MLLVRYLASVSAGALVASLAQVFDITGILCANTGWRLTRERFVQTGMQTIAWLRRAAMAAVTMEALWWPLQSVARADQQSTRQRRQQPPAAANAWAGTP